jgi:hypothetical protein
MPDIAIVWDTPILFEKYLSEHGFSAQRVSSSALGTPFLPRFKLVIIPSGFANPQYSSLLPSLRRSRSAIARFIEKGGILLVYGPMIDHTYDWLPISLKYHHDFNAFKLTEAKKHEAARIILDQEQECDGYFSETSGEKILLGEDRPVLVAIKHDEGYIIATTIHELPAPEFIQWALKTGKPCELRS